MISIEDVSEEKANALLEKENAQLSAVIETAGAVCHELNRPLMVLGRHIELFLMDFNRENPDVKRVRKMSEQVDRMTKITRDLMMINAYKTKEYVGFLKILDIDGSIRKHAEKELQ